MDLSFNSRYPFSKSAKAYMEDKRVKLDYGLVEKGKRRAADALLKVKIPTLSGPFQLEEDIASYVVARMIVSQMKSRQLIERYAVAEAKRASSYLKSDDDENIAALAADFGLGRGPGIDVMSYLRHAPRAPEYKLVNRNLRNGTVQLTRNEFIRVLEEAIRLSISSSLPVEMGTVPPEVKKAADEIRKLMPAAPKPKFVSPGEVPPCMEALLESLKRGENLPHAARWTLTIYLLKTGTPEQEIIKLFSTAPDYNQRTTSYQVSYIRRKGYNMPSCRLIDSNGLCVYRCGIRNPLSYKGKRFNRYAENK